MTIMYKILGAALVLMLFLFLIKMYGDSRYNDGVLTEKQAVVDAAAAKRANDANVLIPKIRRDADARKIETNRIVALAAKELPLGACFNARIGGDDAVRLRAGRSSAAAGAGPPTH